MDSQILNDIIESSADGHITEKGIPPVSRFLVWCPEKQRFVTHRYCMNARMEACLDCGTGEALIVGIKHAPLDIEQAKKEE